MNKKISGSRKMGIQITRPHKEDIEEIREIFTKVITYAFQQDGIEDRGDGIRDEVNKQMSFLEADFSTEGNDVFFLIARHENKIVGTVALTKPSDFCIENLPIQDLDLLEISSVYVLPTEQGKGIGSLLFNSALKKLKQNNITTFCLDGGYKKSQHYWIKKLGAPDVVLNDYWGPGLDHMFWLRKTTDFIGAM